MIGAQASARTTGKNLRCINMGREEGAELLTGGGARQEAWVEGFYIEPLFKVITTCKFSRKKFWTSLSCNNVQRF